MSRAWLPLVTALASLIAGGCKCADDDKPYTPFGPATTAPAPASSAVLTPSAGSGIEALPFTPRRSTSLSPPGGAVEVRGTSIPAPEGWLIDTYLVFDAEGETPSVVAWVVASPGASFKAGSKSAKDDSAKVPLVEPTSQTEDDAPGPQTDDQAAGAVTAAAGHTTTPGSGTPRVGGLWHLTESDAVQLEALPAFIPNSQQCEHQVELSQTGPASLTLDVAARCPSAGIPRAPTRALVVLAMQTPPRRLAQLRLAPAPNGEVLEVSVDSRDRDQDGHDDAMVTFGISPSDGEQSSKAPLIWLDRASGPARDPSEPTKSFNDIGSIERVRATGPNTSKKVPERVESARRLFAYLCEDSGTYRVTDVDGRAFDCGRLGQAFGWYVEAEVTAWLRQKQWAHAISALDRADWYGAAPRPATLVELKEAVRAALPPVATERTRLDVVPRAPGPQPRLSPLSFDADGSLLVQTVNGVSRLRGADVSDASDEVDPWTLVAFNEAGKFVTGLTFPCDETYVFAASRSAAGLFEQALKTDLFAPRPGACAGQRGFSEPALRVVAWLGDDLHAFVGPLEYGRPDQPVAPRGSPLSPDAGSSVAVTSLGLLISNGARTELWAIGPGRTPSECVVSNGAHQVACIEGESVSLFSPKKADPTSHAVDTNANN